MTVFEMMHRSLFSQRWSQGPSCFGRFSVDDPGPLPTPRDRWMWCKRNDSCMGTIGCGRADSAPYHAVNGLFSRLQVVHPLSTIHSVMTEDFLWYIFGCILHLCDYLHQFTSFWLCPFLVTFVSQVLKDLRGYEAGLRGWGAEGLRGWGHGRTCHQEGLNAKSEELGTCQVTGLQYAFAGSFFSDVNEAAQRCAWHDWITERQRTWIAIEWYWMKKWMYWMILNVLDLPKYRKFCTIGISALLGRLKRLILNVNGFNKKWTLCSSSDCHLRYGTGG